MSIVRRGFTLGAQQDPPLVFRHPSIPKLDEDHARSGFLEQERYEKLLEEMPASLKAMLVLATTLVPARTTCGRCGGSK